MDIRELLQGKTDKLEINEDFSLLKIGIKIQIL